MANASIKEILDKLGDDRWILGELNPHEAQVLGANLEGFSGALRKAKYSVNVVLGVSGDQANQLMIDQLKIYLNSISTTKDDDTTQ